MLHKEAPVSPITSQTLVHISGEEYENYIIYKNGNFQTAKSQLTTYLS